MSDTIDKRAIKRIIDVCDINKIEVCTQFKHLQEGVCYASESLGIVAEKAKNALDTIFDYMFSQGKTKEIEKDIGSILKEWATFENKDADTSRIQAGVEKLQKNYKSIGEKENMKEIVLKYVKETQELLTKYIGETDVSKKSLEYLKDIETYVEKVLDQFSITANTHAQNLINGIMRWRDRFVINKLLTSNAPDILKGYIEEAKCWSGITEIPSKKDRKIKPEEVVAYKSDMHVEAILGGIDALKESYALAGLAIESKREPVQAGLLKANEKLNSCWKEIETIKEKQNNIKSDFNNGKISKEQAMGEISRLKDKLSSAESVLAEQQNNVALREQLATCTENIIRQYNKLEMRYEMMMESSPVLACESFKQIDFNSFINILNGAQFSSDEDMVVRAIGAVILAVDRNIERMSQANTAMVNIVEKIKIRDQQMEKGEDKEKRKNNIELEFDAFMSDSQRTEENKNQDSLDDFNSNKNNLLNRPETNSDN